MFKAVLLWTNQITVIKVLISALVMKYGLSFFAFAFHASHTGEGYDM